MLFTEKTLNVSRKSGFSRIFEKDLKQDEEISGRFSQNEIVSVARRCSNRRQGKVGKRPVAKLQETTTDLPDSPRFIHGNRFCSLPRLCELPLFRTVFD